MVGNQRRSTSTASEPSRGTPTTSTSPGSSLDGSNFSSPSSPQEEHGARGSPDDPLPSIEGRDESLNVTSSSSSKRISGTGTDRARTPSVSVSPPSSTLPGRGLDSPPGASPGRVGSPLEEGGRTASIVARLDGLDLGASPSRLGMSDVRDAITDIADGIGARMPPPPPSRQITTASPDAGGPSLGLRQPADRRSRAGSRASLIPHDVRDEEPPPNHFHDPAVQGAFGDAKALAARLAGVLEGSPLHASADSTIKRLHRRARELANFQCPSTRTVGFVGDSGVGEPSLLVRLDTCSNSGAACTCVVTEYHHHARDDFVVEVELFDRDALTNQVDELLMSYRHFHLHAKKKTEEDGVEETEEDRVEEAEEQAKVALDTFRAMFRGRLGDGAFLAGDLDKDVRSTLRSWLDETYPQDEGKYTMGEAEACSRLLMRLTSETAGAHEPAVWPYIKTIKVFLNSHILSKGLVLVDLPGLRDVNSARRKITERYLLHCNEILVICHIGRATTDAGVVSVFDLAKKADLSNVGIVCTKSDDIRAEEAKKDWKGLRAGHIQELSNEVARTQGQIDEAKLGLAELEDEELTDQEDIELELSRRLRKLEQVPPLFSWFVSFANRPDASQLKKYLIENRNAAVSRGLRKDYGERNPDRTLQVFCVSNTEYWARRRLSKDEALPSLHLSGIIALRKHCLAVIGDSQLRIARGFVANDLPALLGDVALWIESGAGSASAEQKRTVREALDKVERRLKRELIGQDSDLGRVGKSIKEEFATEVYNPTYSAFCRQYGSHCTRAAKRRDWNQEAIAKLVKDLGPRWNELCSSIEDKLEENSKLINNVLAQALELILTELEGLPRTRMVLYVALRCRRQAIVSEAEALFVKFNEELGTLRIDALSGIRTSLIGQAMEASYRDCNMQHGEGSDQKRKSIINGALGHSDLFPKYMRDFRDRLKSSADGLQEQLLEILQRHLDAFETTLNLVRDENVATESEENPELRRCLEVEIATAREELGRIEEAMAA
ncbi:hypothetical protein LZ31DRAFT_540968 [Colletotrichum somersetense]|nr:hypothetical protein LZ31DRAFT_540968 [Colletotrichum somersetense]